MAQTPISNAFLHTLLKAGNPVIIVPESMICGKKHKKTMQESFAESFRKRTSKKKQSPTTIIPSPTPG